MALIMNKDNARLTVLGHGWNNNAIDSGSGLSLDGGYLKDIADLLGFDYPSDVDWDALADGLDMSIDPIEIDGNKTIDPNTLNKVNKYLRRVFGTGPDPSKKFKIYPTPNGTQYDMEQNGNDNPPYYIVLDPQPLFICVEDGAEISKYGMVVKAFDVKDDPWTDESHPNGIIPNEEVEINPKVAKMEDAEGTDAYYSGTSSLLMKDIKLLPYTPDPSHLSEMLANAYEEYEEGKYNYVAGDSVNKACVVCGTESGYLIFAADDADKVSASFAGYGFDSAGNWTNTHWDPLTGRANYTLNGKTAWFYRTGVSANNLSKYRVPVNRKSGVNPYELAWEMVYGSVHVTGVETVTVTWKPSNSEPLEDTYMIFIKGDL